MIRVLSKFAKVPSNAFVIDTTSNSSVWKELSPFILGPIVERQYVPLVYSKNFENLWQFSKVYTGYTNSDGLPSLDWYEWRSKGWSNNRAVRYPMGKGAVPLYSW